MNQDNKIDQQRDRPTTGSMNQETKSTDNRIDQQLDRLTTNNEQ
jgi:hypothetical protein